MGLISFFLERDTIVVLAICGGIIATIGSYMVHQKTKPRSKFAHLILRVGYGLTFVSVTLFIVAGFATAYSD